MTKTEETLTWLREEGIAFTVTEHPPVFTMEDFAACGVENSELICKNLFLRDAKGKRHFLVVLKGDKQADLKTLGDALNVRLSFASEDRLNRLLNLERGAVTPLGIQYDGTAAVELVFDADLCGTTVGVHPCENTATVFLAFDDLARLAEKHGSHVELLRL